MAPRTSLRPAPLERSDPLADEFGACPYCATSGGVVTLPPAGRIGGMLAWKCCVCGAVWVDCLLAGLVHRAGQPSRTVAAVV